MTQRVQSKRVGRSARPAIKPMRQGDLDGLCGVYSVVNAMRALCAEVDADTASDMFDILIQALPKAGAEPAVVVAGGVGRRQLAHLIKVAVRYVFDEHDIRLTVRRLPKRLRRAVGLQVLWHTLATAISPSCVAVLGLGGRTSHWTVAVRVTSQQIRLLDSSDMGVLRRRKCTAGKAASRYEISPVHVFVITRREAE